MRINGLGISLFILLVTVQNGPLLAGVQGVAGSGSAKSPYGAESLPSIVPSPQEKVKEIFQDTHSELKISGVTASCSALLGYAENFGLVDKNLQEATDYAKDILLCNTDGRGYQESPAAVAFINQGLISYFEKKMTSDAQYRDALKVFLEKLKALDHISGINGAQLEFGPTLKSFELPLQVTTFFKQIEADSGVPVIPNDTRGSTPDVMQLALSAANGNPELAMEIIASYGHDQVANYIPGQPPGIQKPYLVSSLLYRPGSLGGKNVPEAYIKKVNRYWDVYAQKVLGVDLSKLNPDDREKFKPSPRYYHFIAGAFLGCKLAAQGYDFKVLTPLGRVGGNVAHNYLCSAAKRIGLDNNILEAVSNDQLYQIVNNEPACVSIPTSCAYAYKAITMPQHLSDPARRLYDQGYRDIDDQYKMPSNWKDPTEFEKAKAELDYQLAENEYTLMQHRYGATLGAEFCSKNETQAEVPRDLVDSTWRFLTHVGESMYGWAAPAR